MRKSRRRSTTGTIGQRSAARRTWAARLARGLFALLALAALAQLASQPSLLGAMISQPAMCSTWRLEPAVAEFLGGADEGLYVSDAPMMGAAERHFCLQKDLAPLPIRRIWAPHPGIFLRLQGDVAMLAEIADPVARQRFFDAIVEGAGPGRHAERAEFGSLTILRVR